MRVARETSTDMSNWRSRAAVVTILVVSAVFGTADAQIPTVGTQSSSATEILFLGTAGGPPLRENRSEPSTLLIVDGRPYLIDCGIGTMRRMVEGGISSEDIRVVFFTHLHADHDLGLADVMANDFFRLNMSGSSQTINIYGPPQTAELVDAAFNYITIGFRPFAAEPGAIGKGLRNGKFQSPFVAHEFQRDGLVYTDDKIRVFAAENSHYALMPAQDRQAMKSYSFRIETPHSSIVFTGDTGPSDAVVRLAKGADVLITEVEDLSEVTRFVNQMAEQNHWPPERRAALTAHMRQEHMVQQDVGIAATKAHVKSVVLYHHDPVDPSASVAAVRKYFAGPVFTPADLDRYCMGKPDAKSPANAITLLPCGTTRPTTSPKKR